MHTHGLLNSGGVAVVQDSSITANMTGDRTFDDFGGGIRNLDGGKLTLQNSIVSGNGAHRAGGGIFNDSNSSATLKASSSFMAAACSAATGAAGR
jgi:hypothetical protein